MAKFDLSIMADTMMVEAYKPPRGQRPAGLNLSFGGSYQPVGIILEKMTGEQAEKIAEAVNAILDGDTVQIIPREK